MKTYSHHGISYEDHGKTWGIWSKRNRYRLTESYTLPIFTGIHDRDGGNDFVKIFANGALWLDAGYACDGPSGPTWDTEGFMRGAFVHDALYQLMRERVLDYKLHRKQADLVLHRLCRKDGMSRFRAWYVYRLVRAFGWMSARPKKGAGT